MKKENSRRDNRTVLLNPNEKRIFDQNSALLDTSLLSYRKIKDQIFSVVSIISKWRKEARGEKERERRNLKAQIIFNLLQVEAFDIETGKEKKRDEDVVIRNKK